VSVFPFPTALFPRSPVVPLIPTTFPQLSECRSATKLRHSSLPNDQVHLPHSQLMQLRPFLSLSYHLSHIFIPRRRVIAAGTHLRSLPNLRQCFWFCLTVHPPLVNYTAVEATSMRSAPCLNPPPSSTHSPRTMIAERSGHKTSITLFAQAFHRPPYTQTFPSHTTDLSDFFLLPQPDILHAFTVLLS